MSIFTSDMLRPISDGEHIADAIREATKTQKEKEGDRQRRYELFNPQYCSQCGEKMAVIPNGKFDATTGRQLGYLVCPIYICKDGLWHDFGLWRKKCKKCGDDVANHF